MAERRNAADPEKVAKHNREAEDAKDEQLQDMALVLSTRPGRRLIWRYLSETGIFTTSFNNSGSITAFNEGQRSVGLRLLAEVNEAAPEQYMVMLKESKEKK